MKKLITSLAALLILSIVGQAQVCPSTPGTGGTSSVRWLNSGLFVMNWETSPDATTMFNALATTGDAIIVVGTVTGGTNDGAAVNIAQPLSGWTNPSGTRIRPADTATGNNGESATFTGSVTFNLAAGGSVICNYIAGVYQEPLPVELVSFQASPERTGITLSWKTASEFDNDYFTIQRASDGRRFEDIGMMPGQGTSLTHWNYNFEDNTPNSGVNYYRLAQTDFSGTVNYSSIVQSVFESRLEDREPAVFPTLINDFTSLNIDLSAFAEIEISVDIFDFRGSHVRSLILQGGTLNEINVDDLSNGSYIINSKTIDSTFSTRISIVR